MKVFKYDLIVNVFVIVKNKLVRCKKTSKIV